MCLCVWLYACGLTGIPWWVLWCGFLFLFWRAQLSAKFKAILISGNHSISLVILQSNSYPSRSSARPATILLIRDEAMRVLGKCSCVLSYDLMYLSNNCLHVAPTVEPFNQVNLCIQCTSTSESHDQAPAELLYSLFSRGVVDAQNIFFPFHIWPQLGHLKFL